MLVDSEHKYCCTGAAPKDSKASGKAPSTCNQHPAQQQPVQQQPEQQQPVQQQPVQQPFDGGGPLPAFDRRDLSRDLTVPESIQTRLRDYQVPVRSV